MAATKKDLSFTEARAALAALVNEIGAKAEFYVSLNGHSRRLLGLQLYPHGLCGGVTLHSEADTLRDLVEAGRAKWAEHADLHGENAIRDMALAIIRITHARGECTDAALRAEFDSADIARFAEQACERANEMAAGGPFSIARLAGANDRAQAA